FRGLSVDEKDRLKIQNCNGYFRAYVLEYALGRGKVPHSFIVDIAVKIDLNVYDRISNPMIEELTRIYQRTCTLYDFTDPRNPVAVGNPQREIIPIQVSTVNQENPDED